MQRAGTAPHPEVQRGTGVEAVLEDDLEAEEADVELARAGLVETAQDGGGVLQGVHGSRQGGHVFSNADFPP